MTDYSIVFSHATPFPHLVESGLFADETLRTLANGWPARSDPAWKDHRGRKRCMSDVSRMPAAHREFCESLVDPNWVEYVSIRTGVPDLVADPTFEGGGLHETLEGGALAMHIDFNRLGTLYRRVNLLVFLNDYWPASDGGWLHLGLQSQGVVKIVAPTLGTCVFLDVQKDSWHGHPTALLVPRRLSVAAYYYTEEPPPGYHAETDDLATTRYVGEM